MNGRKGLGGIVAPLLAFAIACSCSAAHGGALVLQTDFGLRDHAVAAMRGVARLVSPSLVIDDLTHEIPAYDVWQASYRLRAVVDYWPADTVFVSVVDPGVGSERQSVVARLKGGQLVVTPNNGTLTLLHYQGMAIRRIDEDEYRLPGSAASHTFHGRDLYVHVGALLASGRLRFDDIGEATEAVLLEHQPPSIEPGRASGGIPVLDPQFGNVWTDIPAADAGLVVGEAYRVEIFAPDGARRFAGRVPFVRTFAAVAKQQPLLYRNSIDNLALALNQGSFAERYDVAPGRAWRVFIQTTTSKP